MSNDATTRETADWDETEYLLRSPRNAERLFDALHRAQAGEGRVMTVEELRRELGLESDE